MLSALHGGIKDIKHTGTTPDSWLKKAAEETIPIKFATELAYKLKAATINEEYEKASFLKDKIEKFSSLLFKLQNANEDRAPEVKKALAQFIYEFKEEELA
jgi:protein-arginine kinase activator protein McsA